MLLQNILTCLRAITHSFQYLLSLYLLCLLLQILILDEFGSLLLLIATGPNEFLLTEEVNTQYYRES